MMKRVLILLVLQYTLCSGWSLFGDRDKPKKEEADTKVVGARIETCRGCRLNYLPRVRAFIDYYLNQYPAVTIKYINGAPPEILWLNTYGIEVGRDSLEPLNEKGIEKLLESKGVTKGMAAPRYTAKQYKGTDVCIAFRGTEDCNPKDVRSIGMDRDCRETVPQLSAGNCECVGGLKLPVECGERNLELTCEALCEDVIHGDVME